MATTATALRDRTAPPAPTAPPPRRRSRVVRVSRAAALTWLAAALAFVLSASVLRDRAEHVEVLVAARDIPAGTELTTAMVRSIELDADSPLAEELLLRGRLEPGMVVDQVVTAGSPIRTSDLAETSTGERLRSMSIQVDRAHAVGGDITVGDLVDVIDVVDGEPTYVVAGVQVTDVAAESSSRGLSGGGGPNGFFVVVQVDARQALALAGAMEDGGVQVVRSTGAEPVSDRTEPAGAGE